MNNGKSHKELNGEKGAAARAALRFVRDGMILGLGSGTTAAHFISVLGEQVRRAGLCVQGVPSSTRIAAQAKEEGVPVLDPRRGLAIDLHVDGADEIAPDLGLIKGAGGALTREKVLARAARRFLVIADSSKLVPRLGLGPLPVEVVPFAAPFVADEIARLGGDPQMRLAGPNAEPFLTDQKNYILECQFPEIPNPWKLAEQLDAIPGLLDHGLFLGYANAALMGNGGTVVALRAGQKPIPAAELVLE